MAKETRHLFQYNLLILVALISLGCLSIMSVLAPICEEYKLYNLSNLFYRFLSNFCHQYPSRSLWLLNRPMGLCARCFSMYSAFPIALLVIYFIKARWTYLFNLMLLMPLIVDGFSQYLYLTESNNYVRFGSGVLFGIGAAGLYEHILIDILFEARNKQHSIL